MTTIYIYIYGHQPDYITLVAARSGNNENLVSQQIAMNYVQRWGKQFCACAYKLSFSLNSFNDIHDQFFKLRFQGK